MSDPYPDSISKDLDIEPNEVQQLILDTLAWRKFVTAAWNQLWMLYTATTALHGGDK